MVESCPHLGKVLFLPHSTVPARSLIVLQIYMWTKPLVYQFTYRPQLSLSFSPTPPTLGKTIRSVRVGVYVGFVSFVFFPSSTDVLD